MIDAGREAKAKTSIARETSRPVPNSVHAGAKFTTPRSRLCSTLPYRDTVLGPCLPDSVLVGADPVLGALALVSKFRKFLVLTGVEARVVNYTTASLSKVVAERLYAIVCEQTRTKSGVCPMPPCH